MKKTALSRLTSAALSAALAASVCFCGSAADAAENGIVSFLSAVYSDTGYEQQGKYELKKENGKITEIIRLAMGVKGRRPFEKYIFEYTDTEISPSRYSLMINYFIADGGGNYYFYNWY